MARKASISAFVALVVFFLACGGSSSRKEPVPTEDPQRQGSPGLIVRPNIVLILTDDQAASDFAYMPKTNSLIGDQGIRLPNFLISVPLCCPSRASILRGQYAHNHGILTNGGRNGGFETFRSLGLETSTAATWLHDSGYRTGLFGKYLNGYATGSAVSHVPPGWDYWASPIDGLASYGQYNYRMNENGKIVAHARGVDDYLDDLIAAKATEFIASAAKAGTPFFAFLAPTAPHSPPVAARRHATTQIEADFPSSEAFNEVDVSDKPGYVRSRPLISPGGVVELQAFQRQRLRSLLAVDDLVVAVVRTLDETGQLGNTYIFVTSDNGWMQGEHRITKGKIVPYEESIRVSMMVRGPGITPKTTDTSLTGNIDLAPTFAEIAGIAPADFVDGHSLRLLLQGRPLEGGQRTAFLIESWLGSPDPGEEVTELSEYHGVRSAGLKYVEYASGERELYDLVKDPAEMENLASTMSPVILAQLSRIVADLQACKAKSCSGAENPVLPNISR